MNAITLLNPYQKMGTDVTGMTTTEALINGGLTGWNQRLINPTVTDGGTIYESGNARALIADLPTGPRVLGWPTTRYEPIQNEEAFTPLLDAYGEAGLLPTTVGAYDGGKATFICFTVPGTATIGGDAIQPYLLAFKRNDGSGSIRITPSAVRVTSGNMITGVEAAARPLIRTMHTRNADKYAVQAVEELLGLTQDWTKLLTADLKDLAKVKVSKQRYTETVAPAALTAIGGARPEEAGRSQTMWDNKFEAIINAWDSPTAARGLNGWRAYSAITEWEQHYRSTNQDVLAKDAIKGWAPAARAALTAISG